MSDNIGDHGRINSLFSICHVTLEDIHKDIRNLGKSPFLKFELHDRRFIFPKIS